MGGRGWEPWRITENCDHKIYCSFSALWDWVTLVLHYREHLTHSWKLVCRSAHFWNFLACIEIIQYLFSVPRIPYNQSYHYLFSSPTVMRVFLFYFSSRDRSSGITNPSILNPWNQVRGMKYLQVWAFSMWNVINVGGEMLVTSLHW